MPEVLGAMLIAGAILLGVVVVVVVVTMAAVKRGEANMHHDKHAGHGHGTAH